MCGISGFTSNPQNFKENIINMTRSMQARGPDAEGIYFNEEIVLGHRRLSILDLNERSNQPMTDLDTELTLVFNGEIYNFEIIKKELINNFNCSFKTLSDTEVIIKSYKYWKEECFEKFDGMFSIAIWDHKNKELILARDKFGEKPLFYYYFFDEGKKQISFASDLQALSKGPKFNYKLSKTSILSYFKNNFVEGERTFYENCKQLAPGKILIFKENQETIKKYFNLSDYFLDQEKYQKYEERAFGEILSKVIKSRMISDVNLGVFMSGGIDSTLISYFAKKNDQNIQSFTLGFEEESYDESKKAKEISQLLGIDNKTFFLNNNHLLDIEKVVLSYDQPMGDTSIIPFFFLSKFSRSYAKVCLSGDGADELFFGYDTYLASYLYKIFCKGNLENFFSVAYNLVKFIPDNKKKINIIFMIKKFLSAFKIKNRDIYIHKFWRSIFESEQLNKILNKNILISEDNILFDINLTNNNAKNNLFDFENFLQNDILVKTDRGSMANSLEVRSPFLSIEILEYIKNLHPNERFSLFPRKKILKNQLLNIIPKKLIYQKKRGFNAPVSYWMQSIFYDIFMDNLKTEKSKEFFNICEVEKILINHKKNKKDDGNILFNIFCFLIWINKTKYTI